MSPRVPAGRIPPVLQVLQALLTMLLAPWRLWALDDECTWQFVLNQFDRVGQNSASDRFFHQEPVDTVESVFRTLVDEPIDLEEKYLGFPYFLKINYSCEGAPSEALIRKGHLTGLKPVVLVTFHSPVNFRRWKIEQLQIQMEAAPFRSKAEACSAEEVCSMGWYTPMPIKNGSVVMHVDISSNGLGPIIPRKRFYLNINGFLKMQQDNTIRFTVGNELLSLIPRYFVNAPSRPLWYTVDQAPVLLLGGIPNEKSVLLTDTSFEDFYIVELNIDSCWVGSFYCPQTSFTATIHDAIATESTLFIRQNQLVYYFTGTYSILQENTSSGSWVRVLANECIKKLCPVELHSNGSEYVMALTTGKNEGYVHFGTITDGRVSFEMLPRQWSVCKGIQEANCSIIWAVFSGADINDLLLLVERRDPPARKRSLVVGYNLVTEELSILYEIPEFIPDARGLEFLMLQRAEPYTSTPLVPKGMFYNPYNKLLFIWGNFLLQSYDLENYIYLADFPKESTIKYLVNSFRGDLAIVTETEEIWYLLEGSYQVYKLFPSAGWEVLISLQAMHQSSLYTSSETMVTLFYEHSKLYQLVYLMKGPESRLVKRLVPVEQLLVYLKLNNSHVLERQGNYLAPTFTSFCPFTVMRLQDLPNPQRYTRQERYRALPPRVLESSGFHSENSLAIYQGLVYYLLWLHSKYDKPYADPVHDPTWRWWKNKKQDQSYYFYLASNRQSTGGVYIEMDSYEKIYNLQPEAELPERIFLDKGATYSFSVFLTARGQAFRIKPALGSPFFLESQLGLGVVLADPNCLEVMVSQSVLINRNSLFFEVMLKDKSVCFDQGISGHHLKRTSVLVRVVGSAGHCFQNTHQGQRVQVLELGVLGRVLGGKGVDSRVSTGLKKSPLKPEGPACWALPPGSHWKVSSGTHSLIWTAKNRTTMEDLAFNLMPGQRLGIEWLCLENSPCHDTVPRSIFAPEFFFKVLVSNRGVDKSTYCDYQLVFLLHIHGLPLSARQSFFFLMVSASIFVGLVALYLMICFLWPFVVKACNVLRWKINNIMAQESYCSYTSSSRVFSVPSNIPSRVLSNAPSKAPSNIPSKAPSKVPSEVPSKAGCKVAEKGKVEPEQT
nr:cation channel sperm-associated protein subunit gamma [Loxodonta africana]